FSFNSVGIGFACRAGRRGRPSARVWARQLGCRWRALETVSASGRTPRRDEPNMTPAASPAVTPPATEDAVSVAEAARLLGRDRTRVYALIRSGDLVALPAAAEDTGPLQVDRASLERWLA